MWLIGTITLGQMRPGSNEEGIPHSLEFQDGSLTTKSSLVSYLEYPLESGLIPQQEM